MTRRPGTSSGWPAARIREPSSSYIAAVARDPVPNDGRRAAEYSNDTAARPAAPTQLTDFVQPSRLPSRANPASTARIADRTTSAWTGPAAWRNVPHWVAAGNTRLVIRNMRRLMTTSGRVALSRPCHGRARMPSTETGIPNSTSTLKRLWVTPATRSSTSPSGPSARWRASVGGSFHAKMS